MVSRSDNDLSLSQIAGCSADQWKALLGPVFEHSPWVATRTYAQRPFATVDALHAAMMHVVDEATFDEKLALLCAHPELAGHEARDGTMTDASTGEQSRLGLTALSAEEFARITALNTAYRARFGFPCIIALRLHADRGSVLDEMQRRLSANRENEIATALDQIAHITRGRLAHLFGAA